MESLRTATITGARGNLGWKLLCHFVQLPQVDRVIGLSRGLPSETQLAELRALPEGEKAEFTRCDLADPGDHRWREAIIRSTDVIHLAAQNPYPEASWADATASFDMTLNSALAAVDAGIKRFVFTSSNHAMGRYKDPPLANTLGPGDLTTDLSPGVGTVWHTGTEAMDSTAYASAKNAGERFCRALAERSQGRTEFVCTRIGWCQPGVNEPDTLSAAGTVAKSTSTDYDSAEIDRSTRWFRMMWLSNRDFIQLHEKAVFADSENWPHPCIVVNGMSANTGMPWSLTEGREWLRYEPEDDVTRA